MLKLGEIETKESGLESIKNKLRVIFEEKNCKKMESEILDFFGENEGEVMDKPYKLPEGLEEDAENIRRLEEWIANGGGKTLDLEVRFVSDVYRGVFLRRDMKVRRAC